jgi:hypothetical protein
MKSEGAAGEFSPAPLFCSDVVIIEALHRSKAAGRVKVSLTVCNSPLEIGPPL